MKYLASIFLCVLFFAVTTGCQSDTSTKTSKVASAPAKVDSSVFKNLANILSQCQKVEYVLYDYGITFETESTNEMQRFFNFIQLEIANTKNCPTNYDGGVVFKDLEGDIKMAMELNIVPECKQVVFSIDGKTYHQVFSDKGIELFKEIIRMRQGG
ncbi:MAG: hypothetical protein R3E32_22845 [Chitinophagales bacterium]